jgi:hypothetical protein
MLMGTSLSALTCKKLLLTVNTEKTPPNWQKQYKKYKYEYNDEFGACTHCSWNVHVATYLFTCLLTDLLTPWSRVLLQNLTGLQLVKKFPTYDGTGRFITAFTSVHYLSLSWASSIQSIPPHPTSWRSTLILSSHLCLGLPSGLSLKFSHQNPVHTSPFPHTRYMPRPSHSAQFHHPHNSGWGVQHMATEIENKI